MRQRLGSQWARSPAPLLAETPLCSLYVTFVLPSVPPPPCSVSSPERVLEGKPSRTASRDQEGPQKGLVGEPPVAELTGCVPPLLPHPLNGHACLPVIVAPALSPRSCPHCVTGTCRHPRVVSTPAAKPAQPCAQPSRPSSERLDAAPARRPKQVRVTLWRDSPHQTPGGQQSGSYSH